MVIRLTSTKQSVVENGIKVLVHGPAGAGKTVLCGTTGEPTVIISAEAGLLSLRGKDIPVIEVKNVEDVHEAYKFLTEAVEAAQFRWVCLDSISEIAEVCLAAEKKGAKDPRQAYGALAERMGELVRAFRDLPGRNVYFSCKQERTKDEQTGAMLYYPSLPGNTLKQGIGYFFDEVFCLRVERDPDGNPYRTLQTARDFNYEAKDRSGALDMFEPPDLAHIHAKISKTL
ncbi:MAG: ATP-binding protein [Zoogloeaceae bacterium]|nr:ATP-binding protein [Zoogloeaceae bacterium]